MHLEPGRRIGPYEILFELGAGGMGTVYAARDTRLDRRIALKFIQRQAAPDHDAAQRLTHEARAASALNHPNVCQIYDVGGEGGESWIAMEYVEGRPLASTIGPSGLPAETVVRVGVQIADALAHAHGRGVLHRDLKSANIVCDAAGRPKILDFGIALQRPRDVAEEVTRTGTRTLGSNFAGTLAYLAPEVVRGEAQDERSDLWSFGVVLYEMLTGGLPFRGRNVFDVAAAIVGGPPPQLPPHVPQALANVVLRLLAKDPAARYQTAEEVAVVLATLSNEPTLPSSRRTRPIAAALIAVAVVAGTAGYAFWQSRFRPLTLTNQQLVSPVEAAHRAPAYSPDGKMLAFTAPDADGVSQVWVRILDQPVPSQVTSGSVGANRPRWLRTINRIIYALDGGGIWSVSPLGGAPTRLIERGANPNVSLDGRRIVYEDRGIWTAAPDGSDVRKVPGVPPTYFFGIPRGPALSPDGSTIVYFQPEFGPNGDFWIVPSAGGTPTRLTSDLREGGWPAWTPDGRAIVFSSARRGSRTLWQIPAAGGEPRTLTTGAGEDDQPDISADGRQLAYTNVRNIWQLRVRSLPSGEERTLFERGLEVVFPTFSPDGRRIVYFGRADQAVAVFTIGVDGSDQRQITGERELNHHPRWGAEGEDIYFFQSAPTDTFRRVPAVGGPSREFRPWSWITQTTPQFDPTGRYIAYLRQRPLGAPQTVTEHTVIHEIAAQRESVWPEPHTHPSDWSDDGTSILGWQHDSKSLDGRIVICRVADASCRPVTHGSSPKLSTSDGRIYFLRRRTGVRELWSVMPDGMDERRLGEIGPFREIDVFFDVSRDGLLAWAPFRAGHQELWRATIQ